MKSLPLIFLVLIIVTSNDEIVYEDLFNFRVKTLEQFNMVRRIVAAGDIAKIYKLISTIVTIFEEMFPENIFGPAANMHKLKWSRRLEQISFEYMEEIKDKPSDIRKSIHYKDHIGFLWIGNILNLLGTALAAFPTDLLGSVKDTLKDVLTYVEVIVIIFWMIASAPNKLPLTEKEYHGPVEALFAERYEIGCWSDPYYSICFLNQLPYRREFFQVGPACTNCSTHCEFWAEKDKTIVEGDLCVPPQPHQEQMMEIVTETMIDLTTGKSVIPSVIISLTVYFLIRLRG